MPCSVAWKQELEAVFWCVYVSLNDGCANLGIFWDALFFEKHFKASIRGAVHSLGQVQLACRKEIKLAQQLQKQRQRGWSSLLKPFYIGVIS
jgi:hypothetical protein